MAKELQIMSSPRQLGLRVVLKNPVEMRPLRCSSVFVFWKSEPIISVSPPKYSPTKKIPLFVLTYHGPQRASGIGMHQYPIRNTAADTKEGIVACFLNVASGKVKSLRSQHSPQLPCRNRQSFIGWDQFPVMYMRIMMQRKVRALKKLTTQRTGAKCGPPPRLKMMLSRRGKSSFFAKVISTSGWLYKEAEQQIKQVADALGKTALLLAPSRGLCFASFFPLPLKCGGLSQGGSVAPSSLRILAILFSTLPFRITLPIHAAAVLLSAVSALLLSTVQPAQPSRQMRIAIPKQGVSFPVGMPLVRGVLYILQSTVRTALPGTNLGKRERTEDTSEE